ncbi:hypothetical protein TrRE_jg13520 [Triparma retinervis]|uniref:Uncharacterized protein n=1 Tax=Triparma retinervis TaxID=2557542 RepID=A0A9W6Z976_9STRA|nr:hypothetical protein TrRE_jg13520 [Triparma retinervis]
MTNWDQQLQVSESLMQPGGIDALEEAVGGGEDEWGDNVEDRGVKKRRKKSHFDLEPPDPFLVLYPHVHHDLIKHLHHPPPDSFGLVGSSHRPLHLDPVLDPELVIHFSSPSHLCLLFEFSQNYLLIGLVKWL